VWRNDAWTKLCWQCRVDGDAGPQELGLVGGLLLWFCCMVLPLSWVGGTKMYVAMGALPPVTEVAQVMRGCGGVTVGKTGGTGGTIASDAGIVGV
jgi:hypothetical protein